MKSGPNFTGLRFTQQMTKPQTMTPYPDNHCPPSKTQGLDCWKMDLDIPQMTKNAGNGITTHRLSSLLTCYLRIKVPLNDVCKNSMKPRLKCQPAQTQHKTNK